MLRIFEGGQEILLPETDEEREAEIFRRIDEVKEKNLTALDLGGLGLTEISDAVVERVKEVSWITELYLGPHRVVRERAHYPYTYTHIDINKCNSLHKIPSVLFKVLPRLMHLDLTHNSIGNEGAKTIAGSLIQIKVLALGDNSIGDEGAKALASLHQITTLGLSSNDIGEEGVKAIAASLKQLKALGLGNNNIGSDGAKAIALLKQLKTLYLSGNRIGDEGLKDIASSLTQLSILDLGSNDIRDEGAKSIASFSKLTALGLANNGIQAVGAKAIAASLTQLDTLDLGGNGIGDEGSKAIAASLTNLIALDLSNNNIGAEGARSIASSLTQLTTLGLGGNAIKAEGAKAIATSLKKLIALDLSGNSIQTDGANAISRLTQLKTLGLSSNGVGDKGAKAIASFLTKLSTLNLGNNSITDEGAKAIASSLTKLLTLNLGNNNIADEGVKAIADSLGQLTALGLSGNSIGVEGAMAIASSLKNLTSLNLGSNHIEDEGTKAIASSLTNLTGLYLSRNRIGDEGAKAIAASLTQLILLDLSQNNITIVPKEALSNRNARRIFSAIEDRLKKKSFPLNEAKLIVVGEGAVGKTSLIRYMVNGKPRRESEEQTIGADIQDEIETHEWFVTEETEKNDIKLNIWDFGGQEIMHGTHQYFLTERSLYLLVLDGRKKDDNTVYKWLKLIRNRGNDSPVLIVINKAVNEHEKQKVDLDRKDLLKKFPNIVGFMETSCNDNEDAKNSIEELKKTIVLTLQNNPHLKHIFDRLPEAHLQIKDDLSAEAEEKKVLKKDRFKEICVARGVTDEERQAYLLQLFHDLGIVIAHGIDPDAPYVVKDINLLDPNWLVTAIYEILMQTKLSSERGEFCKQDLCKWLKKEDYPEDWHEFIIAMMQHESIALCFELADKNTYLIPEALPRSAPDFENWPNSLSFRYRYDLLPRNLLPRFMVAAQEFHSPNAYRWLTGVVLNVYNCKVLVTADLQYKKIDIKVDGSRNENECRSALAVVRGLFLKEHQYNRELNPTAVAPVPDDIQKEIKYQELIDFEKDPEFGPEHKICKKVEGGVWTVRELLDGVGRQTNIRERDMPDQQIIINGPGVVNTSHVNGDQNKINQINNATKPTKEPFWSFLTNWQKFAFLVGSLVMLGSLVSLNVYFSDLTPKWKLTLGGIPLVGAIAMSVVLAFNPKYFYRRMLSVIIVLSTVTSLLGQIAVNLANKFWGFQFDLSVLALDWKILIMIGMLLAADVYLNRGETQKQSVKQQG